MLRGLFAHSLQAADFPLDGLGDLFGELSFAQLRPILGSDVGVFAQLLANGFHLLTEDVVLLPFLDLLGRLVSHLAPELEIGQDFTHPDQELAEPLADVEGLEELHFLLEGEVGRVDGEVGETRRVVDVE